MSWLEAPSQEAPGAELVHSASPMAIHWSSRTQEQLTPKVVLDKTLEFYETAQLDLDPCAEGTVSGLDETKGVIRPRTWNVPAYVHYTITDDGLAQSWYVNNGGGAIYVNPPYNSIARWVAKAVAVCEDEQCDYTAILLCPARPGSRWWKALRNFPCCFIDGRLHFNEAVTAAPFPSAIFLIDPAESRHARFASVFVSLGDVWKRMRV